MLVVLCAVSVMRNSRYFLSDIKVAISLYSFDKPGPVLFFYRMICRILPKSGDATAVWLRASPVIISPTFTVLCFAILRRRCHEYG